MKKEKDTHCPITRVAALLSDSWTMRIVYELNKSTQRFCELERALDGISTRTLTLKLTRLTEEGVVEKNPDGAYMTTRRGKGLKLIENAMRRYEKNYL